MFDPQNQTLEPVGRREAAGRAGSREPAQASGLVGNGGAPPLRVRRGELCSATAVTVWASS